MEIWKEIKDYEGLYWISNLGRVKSKRKTLQSIDGKYLKVGLSKNGIQKTKHIHRLVAETFIPNPYNKLQVNHKDENKKNNNANNLEWVTQKENANYGKRNEKVSNSQIKYKVIQKSMDGKIIKIWNSAYEIEKNTKYKKNTIHCCCNRKQSAY